jgi:hypothetical protein
VAIPVVCNPSFLSLSLLSLPPYPLLPHCCILSLSQFLIFFIPFPFPLVSLCLPPSSCHSVYMSVPLSHIFISSNVCPFSVCLHFCPSPHSSLSSSPPFYLSPFISFSCPSPCLFLSFLLCLPLSLSGCLSVYLHLYFSKFSFTVHLSTIKIIHFLPVFLSLSVFPSLSDFLSLSVFLSLFIYLSLLIFVSLSLSVFPCPYTSSSLFFHCLSYCFFSFSALLCFSLHIFFLSVTLLYPYFLQFVLLFLYLSLLIFLLSLAFSPVLYLSCPYSFCVCLLSFSERFSVSVFLLTVLTDVCMCSTTIPIDRRTYH